MLLCKFCNKHCPNGNSLRNHERLCKNNPNKQTTWLMKNQDKVPRKNGFTKAKEEGREYIVSEETRRKLSIAVKSRPASFAKAVGKKVSKTINEKVANGTWHTSLAKHMHIDYNGVDMHGSWEFKYAKYLDEHGIRWKKNKESFQYIFENKIRRYTPDFYLEETDEYVEIKGYKTEKDDAKWSQFPSNKKLVVLMKKELRNLGIDGIE